MATRGAGENVRLTKALRKAGKAKEASQGRSPRPVGGRPPRTELTAQQLRGIRALLTQPTLAAAATEISVHPRTMSRWFDEQPFNDEYYAQMTELQVELWRQMLGVRSEVWNRFLELMRSADERIALRATTWFLDRILSVPTIMGKSATDHEPDPTISPRLSAFLNEVGARDRADAGDDAA